MVFPLLTTADIFRAGHAAIRGNPVLYLICGGVLALSAGYSQPQDESLISFVTPLVSLVAMLGALAAMFLHSLRYFLSSGATRYWSEVWSKPVFMRLFWRLLLMGALTVVFGLSAFGLALSILGWEPGGAAISAQASFVGGLVIIVVMAIVSIFWGLRLPHVVDKGFAEEPADGLKAGLRQFNPLLAFLARGPVLLNIAFSLISIGVFRSNEVDLQGAITPAFVMASIAGAVAFVYAVAMTAACLTDAYLRDRREAPEAYRVALHKTKT